MTALTQASCNVRFGLLITAIGGFLFTFDLPLLRLADNDKWTLVFARGLFLFLSITAVWWFMRLRTGSKTPYIAGAAGLAVIATNTVANIAYIGALKETNAANVVFILALVPVLTAVFSRIFIKEEIHNFTWVATVLALIGVGIIVQDSLTLGGIWGDFLAFLCAACTAAAFTIIRASGKNIATSLAVGSLLSALIALVFFDVNAQNLLNIASFGMPSWFWVALNGLLVIPLSSALIANGPRFLPSADVSMFFLLETILTPIWIWMLFAEIPSNAVLIGGFIVIVTLVAHSLWRLRSSLTAQGAE
jgi:drug/metabolite transporter (DMT)-like permease